MTFLSAEFSQCGFCFLLLSDAGGLVHGVKGMGVALSNLTSLLRTVEIPEML